MTSQFYLDFIGTLEKERDAYAEMIRLSAGKRDAVVEGDIEGLERVMDGEREVLAGIAELAAKREEQCGRIAEESGVAEGEITLSRLIAVFPDEELRARAEEARQGFIATVKELHRTNEVNRELLEAQLKNISASLTMFSQVSQVSGVYGKDGEMNDEVSRFRMFDTTV